MILFSNKGDLRKFAWNGIPNELRPIAWQLLLVNISLFFLVRRLISYFVRDIFLFILTCEIPHYQGNVLSMHP